MVVLPPNFNLRWGTHRPTSSFAAVLSPLAAIPWLQLFLTAALFLVALSPSPTMGDSEGSECLIPGHSEVKPKFLYIKDKQKPITLLTSRRIPHQLLTQVVAIFLRKHLGYVKVVLTYHDGFLPHDVMRGMGYSYDIYSIPEDFIPNALADLEMWTPPRYSPNEYFPLNTDNYLGVVGRLGWFFPYYVVEKYGLIDHWRSFAYLHSEAVRVFARTQKELDSLDMKMKDPVTNKYYCSDPRCKKGVYSPPLCSDKECAVLFSSYFNQSSFLIDHVFNMSLYIKVAWLGPNLNKDFLKENMFFADERSILFFHFTPDVLLQPFNLTSVAFPSCADHIEYSGMNKSHFCMYEMHRFNKVIWSGLKNSDNYLYKSLERVSLTGADYDSLIEEYNRHPSRPIEQIACKWMIENQDIWTIWRNGDTKPSLYFVGLFPVNTTVDKRKFLAPGNVPAFNMAIKAVNENDSILPHHHLEEMVVNTECEPDIVMLEFIKIIQFSTKSGKYSKIIGIVGPACSDTVEPIAGVSKYFKMPIISYGAEGAIFSDRDQYPYFFRTIPENKIFRHVYLQLFKKLGWKRIASLTEDGHQYSEYLTPLQDLLQDNGISFNMRKYPQGRKTINMTQYLFDLKKQNFRIIIGDFYQDVARFVLCQAIQHEMTGHQGYVWFVPRWYSDDWYDVDYWNQNSSMPVPCTTNDMIEGLQGHMSLSYKYYADDDRITPENESVGEWKKRYKNLTDELGVPESDYAGFTYDTIWTYSLALHKLFEEDDSYTSNLRSKNTTERFIHYINNTNFDGVSGHINFTNGPSRVTDIVVWQYTNRSYIEVGRFYPDATDDAKWGRLDLKMNKLKWPTNTLPKDGSKECIVESLRLILGEEVTCNTTIVVLCILGFVLCGFILVIVMVFLKRRYDVKLAIMEEMWKDQSIFKKFEGWEIPRSKVVINRKLGEGQFGTVYGGECFVEDVGWLAVAVKTLKVGSTIAEKLDFLSEAEMMKNFEHENIVKLLGVCTESEPIYTVMEFMLYGDLKTYLLARRNLVNEKNRNSDDEVSNRRLTSMALDVARALSYLAEMKFVHRDVACRNCLVNTHRSVKLADFGMTRHLNEKNYYRFSRKGMLPVRWMAPESLVEGVFTTCSDIWSYGVLLYEIITFGAFPFQGLSNNQVFERVKSGHTLPIPAGILPALECLLQGCWHPVPSKRLTAEQIVMHLENSPRLISPSLEAPQASLAIEDSAGLELRIPDKSRKLSLSLNSRAMLTQGVGSVHSGGGGTSAGSNGRRKRSMSGNMVVTLPALTTSLSEDGMISSYNIEALNLNQVMIEEAPGERDMGEDPLLPPSQYISTRFMSLSHRDIERGGLRDAYGVTGIPKDMWTNITPV